MEDKIKLGSKTLNLLLQSLLPYHYRIDSVLEDIFKGRYHLGEIEKSILLEHASCSTALKNIFEDLLKEMEEQEVEELFLKKEEYINILSMTKNVESASRIIFGNFGLWAH